MKKLHSIIACFILISTASAQTVKLCKPCEELLKLQLPDVTILVAEAKTSDTIVTMSKTFCLLTESVCRLAVNNPK